MTIRPAHAGAASSASPEAALTPERKSRAQGEVGRVRAVARWAERATALEAGEI